MIIITIPAFNEEKTLGQVLDDINKVMKDLSYDHKILVVDDGSTDNTSLVAKNHGAAVFAHPKNYGLAETFKTEIEQCLKIGAEIIVHIDADGQYHARDITRLIEEVKKGNDLVLGSRFKGNIEYMPFINKIGNRAFSAVISGITKTKITDAQTGLRAFSQEVAKKVGITSNFTYTQEQIIRAIKLKFKVKEIPVDFARRKDKSRLFGHPFSYAIKAGLTILRIYRDYEPLKFFTFIGGSLFGTGFLIGIWLLYLFLSSGAIRHIPSAILSMLFIVIGIQILIFGFLADMIKNKRINH